VATKPKKKELIKFDASPFWGSRQQHFILGEISVGLALVLAKAVGCLSFILLQSFCCLFLFENVWFSEFLVFTCYCFSRSF